MPNPKDGAVLAKTGDFMDDADGAEWIKLFQNPDSAFDSGVKAKGKQYNCLRAEKNKIYSRAGLREGLLLNNAGNVIVVGYYTKANFAPHATQAVENVSKFLDDYKYGSAVPQPPPNLMVMKAASKPRAAKKEKKEPVKVPDAPAPVERHEEVLKPREITRDEAAAEQQAFDGVSPAVAEEEKKAADAPSGEEKVKVAHRCAKCHDFVTDKWAKAQDNIYHQECLVCVGPCGKSLEGTFYLHGDDPWCEACHMEKLKCAVCGEGLKDTYFIRNDKNYHEACVPKPPCTKCSKPIEGEIVTTDEQNYHRDCFKCETCQCQLGDAFFKTPDGLKDVDANNNYCATCVTKLGGGDVVIGGPDAKLDCDICGGAISPGDFIKWNGKQMHTSCLKCQKCESVLAVTDPIYILDDKPLCEPCSKK